MPTKVYLSYEDLGNFLQVFFANIKGKSYIFYDFFWNLYKTGLRYQELKRLDLWYYDEDNGICIQTLKGGNPRINMQPLLTDFAVNAFIENNAVYSRLCNSTLCFWLETFLPYSDIYHDTKSIKTHLFRHHLAKKMKYEGYSDTDIANFFGEVDIGNMRNYINSDLYYWQP
jgi:hypothetical protein